MFYKPNQRIGNIDYPQLEGCNQFYTNKIINNHVIQTQVMEKIDLILEICM